MAQVNAEWSHPKRKKNIKGTYEYNWAGDFFVVSLHKKCPITRKYISHRVYNDTPEWDKWTLVR